MLQRHDLTLRDFYGIWIQTKNKLNSVSTSLSKSIVHFMEISEKKLLENDVFISSNIPNTDINLFVTLDNNRIKIN